MKQFQTAYQDRDSFRAKVAEWAAWRAENAGGQALVHIFSDGADDADVKIVRDVVEQVMPDAAYLGASASGNIYEGNITTEKLAVTCTIFEHPDSFVRTRLISIENRDATTLRTALRQMKDDFASVKAIEVIMTIDTIPIREVCAILQEEIPEKIPIWGGGAFGDNIFTAYIFEKGEALNAHGIVLAMIGGEDFNPVPNGEGIEAQEYYTEDCYLWTLYAPTILLSYSELQFIKAEILARQGKDNEAKQAVLEAVKAAFEITNTNVECAMYSWGFGYAGDFLTDEDAEAYCERVIDPLSGDALLAEIMVQKYIAFHGANGGSVEAYNDIRRLKAEGKDYIKLANPSQKFPLRAGYGSSDTTTNPNVQAAFGDGSYVFTENVWWAGGNR